MAPDHVDLTKGRNRCHRQRPPAPAVVDALGDAQARRRGAAVVGDLVGGRCLGNSAHEAHGAHRVAHAGQPGRAGAAAGHRLAEALLDDAVLAGVVRRARRCGRRVRCASIAVVEGRAAGPRARR